MTCTTKHKLSTVYNRGNYGNPDLTGKVTDIPNLVGLKKFGILKPFVGHLT